MAHSDIPARPRARALRIALVLSLALNVAFIGAIAGAFLGDGPRDRRATASPDMVLPYTRALSRDDRRTLREGYRMQGGGRPPLADVLGDYSEVVAILRADPFDPAAFEAKLTAQAAGAAERQQTGRRLLTERIRGMSAAERLSYADRLEAEVARLAEHVQKRGVRPEPGQTSRP